MNALFLFVQQTDYSKYAAWISLALLSLAGAHFLKGVVSSALLKLYEVFIQKNGIAL